MKGWDLILLLSQWSETPCFRQLAWEAFKVMEEKEVDDVTWDNAEGKKEEKVHLAQVKGTK